MSQEQKKIDTRATAYAFGELSPTDSAAFEQELRQSARLRAELAEIRDAIGALESEFHSEERDVGVPQREAIEHAISSQSPVTPPPVMTVMPVPPSVRAPSGESAYRGAMTVSVLVACALIVVALVVPELREGGGNQVALTNPGELSQLLNAFNEAVESNRLDEAAAIVSKVEKLKPNDPIVRTLLLGIQQRDQMGVYDEGDVVPTDLNAEDDPNAEDTIAERDDVKEEDGSIDSPLSSGPSAQAEPGDDFEMGDSDASGSGAGSPDANTSDASTSDASTSDASGGFDDFGDFDASEDMSLGGMGGMSELADAEMEMGMMDMMDMGMGVPESVGAAGGLRSNHAVERKRRRRRSGAELSDRMMMGGMMDEMEMAFDMGEGDRYEPIVDNPFQAAAHAPLSTFSIDVDTASYAKMRSMINRRALPHPNSVRVEEFINYFDYDYPDPRGEHPFSASMDIVECPWNPDHRLARIGIQGKRLQQDRPSSNLVFLLDVSGSMNEPNKLPLVIEGMTMLTDQLTENDRVSIVVYAGAAGLVLEPTRGDRKGQITAALRRLHAGGSTNGEEGIRLAYEIARDHFISGGTNRVILCSDGDFNVGVTGTDELVALAKEQAKSNIFLTVLGFGTGNHNDQMMEQVSNQANGNYAFVDGRAEARKVLVEELGGTLVTIAKDVKIQVEFNPARVAEYRLIGYENRLMAAEDFADDKKDGGEIGAGHRVTALYELVPQPAELVDVYQDDPLNQLRYREPTRLSLTAAMGELFNLNLRYKQPEGDTSIHWEVPVKDTGKAFRNADRDLKLAAAAAGFGMLLRDSPYKGNLTMSQVAEMASEAALGDDFGYRKEFFDLVKKARHLRGGN